ncbi:MAG: chromate transporter [Clostridia bacterium]|nr:chromate transporter [Clostridia bacterium]
MIFLELFLTFLKIGLVSFGGGYGMIPLIREEVLASAWLTEDSFLDLVAVAESTPGPIAVNMATFVGSSQGGIFGAFVATLGVVLPSFLIILLIASLARMFLMKPSVQAMLLGVRPAVVGLILATGVTMLLSSLFSLTAIGDPIVIDFRAGIIFLVLVLFRLVLPQIGIKKVSPIFLIVISAVLGVVFYGVLGT